MTKMFYAMTDREKAVWEAARAAARGLQPDFIEVDRETFYAVMRPRNVNPCPRKHGTEWLSEWCQPDRRVIGITTAGDMHGTGTGKTYWLHPSLVPSEMAEFARQKASAAIAKAEGRP